MSTNYHVVSSPEHLQELLSADLQRVSVLYFRADWAEPCVQMDSVTTELAKRWQDVLFLSIEAESLADISESFDVDAVPFFILLRGHTLLTRLSGAQPAVLSSAISAHASAPKPKATTSQAPEKPPVSVPTTAAAGAGAMDEDDEDEGEEETEEELEARCKELMEQAPLVLFMKGDRNTPRCGFSQKIVGILNKQEVEYETFDILSDEGVRQKLKAMNEWPTFPQLIIKGEFVGGLDVVNEMVDNGEFKEMLEG